MAKVEAGKMKLTLSTLPMKIILSEISLLVADLVSKKKLQMVLEIADDLPNIEADELNVKEIIYNLLSNAVKFTPEGGKNRHASKEHERRDRSSGLGSRGLVSHLKTWRKYLKVFSASILHILG